MEWGFTTLPKADEPIQTLVRVESTTTKAGFFLLALVPLLVATSGNKSMERRQAELQLQPKTNRLYTALIERRI